MIHRSLSRPLRRRRYQLRRTQQLSCWLVVTVLVCHLWSTALWPRRYIAPGLFGQAVFSVQTEAPLLALTFDDGPNPEYTPQVLASLAAHGAKATFFMVGKALEAHPEVAAQVMAQGHEIGNHTWHHYSLNYLGPTAIRQEIEATDRIIRHLGYTGEIAFRPPYGHNLLFLPWVLNRMGRANVFWSIDPKDWDLTASQSILARLQGRIQPGGIIVLHDGDATPETLVYGTRAATVEAVEQILTTYEAQGYRFVTLSELMAAGPRALWRPPQRVAAAP